MEREEELEQTIDELNYRLTNALKNIDRLKLSIKQAIEEIESKKYIIDVNRALEILDELIAESEG